VPTCRPNALQACYLAAYGKTLEKDIKVEQLGPPRVAQMHCEEAAVAQSGSAAWASSCGTDAL